MALSDLHRDSPDESDRQRPAGRNGLRRHRLRRQATPYLLIAPTLVLFAGFLAYPIGSVFYYSLREYNVTQPWNNGFIGLDMNRPGVSGDSVPWEGWGHVREYVEKVPGRVA